MTDALGARLGDAIQLNAAIQCIEEIPGGWRVHSSPSPGTPGEGWGGGLADDRKTIADHPAVLYTSPAHKLPEIRLAGAPELKPAALKEIIYPPVASVVLGFRREQVPHPLDGFGMLIPQVEGFAILGTLFSSSVFPNRAPAGHVILTTYIGGSRAPDLALRPADELIEMTLADLGVLLGVTGRPTFEHVAVYRKAIPQYEVGYGRFKDLMAEIEARVPGIFFAGHYRNGISLGDSIVSGDDAAGRIADFWKKRS